MDQDEWRGAGEIGAAGSALVDEVLRGLLSASSPDASAEREGDDAHGRAALRERWSQAGLITGGDGQPWELTDLGRRSVTGGIVVASPENVMLPRPVPLEDQTRFELFGALEAEGWECDVLSCKREIQRARNTFYREGSPKVWFLIYGEPVSKAYLLALLAASQHKADVRHLGAPKDYRALMGQAEAPKRRRLPAVTGYAEGLINNLNKQDSVEATSIY